MKFLAIVVIALIAAVSSAPTQITDNNVGDIITIGINADLNLSNNVDVDIVNVIVGLINQQAAIDDDSSVAVPLLPATKTITPELLESIKRILSKEVKSA
ncbi:unnamed protein product [Diamesa tonsa]